MTSIQRIKGANGVIIDSNAYLEVPKAPTQTTPDAIRNGMFRYNRAWKAFEGVIDFDDGSVAYRRFAQLDANGRLLTSQLPESITSGLTYVGTFDPIIDDIDPPFTKVVLPAASPANAGDYYIVRGIQDAAVKHLAANPTANPFVIYSPTDSAWTQIKYYIGKDPSTGTNTIVISAYARFNTVPAGHPGITQLAAGDVGLTAPFTNVNNPSLETALSDSDWVIMTDTTIQRLRQNRVSILASSVAFDNTVLQSLKRQFVTNNSTVQGAIDNLGIYGLRRTGDSMTNDGTAGAGRLAITYGTAVAPAIAFNDGTSDPDLNSGMVPSEWTDPTTGIFHPAMGNMGFSSSGVEKIRITPIGLLVVEAGNINVANNAAIQFQGTGNTVANPGISAINDTMSFTVKGKVQLELKDGSSLFHGSVTIDQNLSVGGNSAITGNETIGGNLTVTGNGTINGNTILGDAAADTLTVNATSTFNAVSTFNANTTFNGASNRFKNLNIMPAGIVTLEHATTPTTIVQETGNLKLNMTSFGDITINDGATVRTKFNRYGVKLPILNPIDNAVGEDGMIAYSTQRNTVMQKANGQWTTVSGGGVEQAFAVSSWVLSGSYYTYTVSSANIQSIEVQESVGANFSKVEVDSVVISPTNAVISIPSTPDWRFAGRLIITYR